MLRYAERHHNRTVEQITHPSFVLPSPPTLRTALNPRVGDKLLDGDNRYQQALLLGFTPVHQSNDDYLLFGHPDRSVSTPSARRRETGEGVEQGSCG